MSQKNLWWRMSSFMVKVSTTLHMSITIWFLKMCLSCACLERQIITAEREHTFPSCCNNWYKNESRNIWHFFFILILGVEFFYWYILWLYLMSRCVLHSYNVYDQLQRVIQLLIIILLCTSSLVHFVTTNN